MSQAGGQAGTQARRHAGRRAGEHHVMIPCMLHPGAQRLGAQVTSPRPTDPHPPTGFNSPPQVQQRPLLPAGGWRHGGGEWAWRAVPHTPAPLCLHGVPRLPLGGASLPTCLCCLPAAHLSGFPPSISACTQEPWKLTRNQELNIMHVSKASAFLASTNHHLVRGDTLVFDFVFFMHPVSWSSRGGGMSIKNKTEPTRQQARANAV
jgi:hypothetical protein